MRPLNEKLNKIQDAAAAAGEAVSAAGDTCFTIVAGQLAGFGANCLDKLFLTEERHSTKPKKKKNSERSDEPISLSRKKAEKLAATLSQNVSTPPDPTAPSVEE